jgi:hypothetical protein
MEMEMNLLTKWWIWVILIIGGGIAAFFLFFNKEDTQQKPKKWKYFDPQTGESKEINYAPGPLTDRLYKEINSYYFRDNTPFQELAKLSDGEIVAVATDWNNRYKKDSGETLLMAITSEYTIEKTVYDTIVNKLTSLNIS